MIPATPLISLTWGLMSPKRREDYGCWICQDRKAVSCSCNTNWEQKKTELLGLKTTEMPSAMPEWQEGKGNWKRHGWNSQAEILVQKKYLPVMWTIWTYNILNLDTHRLIIFYINLSYCSDELICPFLFLPKLNCQYLESS